MQRLMAELAMTRRTFYCGYPPAFNWIQIAFTTIQATETEVTTKIPEWH
jgi:hypothetical protein